MQDQALIKAFSNSLDSSFSYNKMGSNDHENEQEHFYSMNLCKLGVWQNLDGDDETLMSKISEDINYLNELKEMRADKNEDNRQLKRTERVKKIDVEFIKSQNIKIEKFYEGSQNKSKKKDQ